MKNLKGHEVRAAIEPALAKLGLKGQVDICMNGTRSTSWIGKPADDDVLITVTIKKIEPSE